MSGSKIGERLKISFSVRHTAMEPDRIVDYGEATFYKKFKKRYHMMPVEYRQNSKKEE